MSIRPVIIGGAARLPFLWVLLGILGGLESFGIIGLFLGPGDHGRTDLAVAGLDRAGRGGSPASSQPPAPAVADRQRARKLLL